MGQFDGLRNLPEKIGHAAAAYAAYWLSLPKRDGVPLKKSLDPGAMRKFLANFVIVERHDRLHFTWRLVGSGVRDLAGVELTGANAFDAHSEPQRGKALAAYNAQLDTPCGVWGVTILRSAAGFEIATEVMVFPLRADDGEVRFLANTVEPFVERHRLEFNPTTEMLLLSWPKHRFIDIGFGMPKFPPRAA